MYSSIYGVMVDSRTKFVVNLRNIQEVINVYLRKKDQTSVRLQGKTEFRNNLKIVV